MTVLKAGSEPARNPRTLEEVEAMVRAVESLFMPWNVDGLVAGFTPDCVIRFCDIPEFRGQDKLHTFFTARSQRQKNYTLVKTLKSFTADTVCNTWEGKWEDAQSGEKMTGFGCEVWKLRDGKISEWDGAFNAKPVGSSGPMEALLK